MSLPRQVLPEKFWFVTRRATQREFLLRPDDAMNNAFLYCLIEAAQRFQIRLLLTQMMSNHHHTIFYDSHGMAVEFYHRFHTHLAKCVNALRGRWENMWSSEPTCLVELTDSGAVLDKLVYTATNPVKDGLVEKVHHWPGPNTLNALFDGRVLRARRPDFLFRDDGTMPEEVEIQLVLPAELGDVDPLLLELRRQIAEVEAACARDRQATGRQVVGRRAIRRQSWRHSPTSREPRRNLRPRVAGRSKWARIQALQRNRDFVPQYRAARARWLAGEPAEFPAGTYWLARFAHVPVAATSPPCLPLEN